MLFTSYTISLFLANEALHEVKQPKVGVSESIKTFEAEVNPQSDDVRKVNI